MRQNHIGDAGEPTENSQVREVLVQAAQISQLYSQSQWGLIGALLSAVVLVVALWSVVSQARLIFWLVCYLCIQVVRYLLVASFHRASPSGKDTVSWGRWFALSTVASGLVWGSAGVFLFPLNSMAHQFLLALFLAGISAAAAVVYSATMECFLPTIMAELLPISARYLYQGDEFSVIIGSVIPVFAAVLSITGRHMHLTIADSLRLKFERSELIESLEKARNGLELRVAERTSDLVRVNQTLQEEIEHRKKMEEDLRRSEEKYRLLVENAHELICVIQEGLFAFVNRRAVELSGYSEEELAARPFMEIVHPDDREMALQRYLETMSADATTDPFVVSVLDKWGNTRWGYARGVRIDWNGKPAALVFGIEITDLRRAEEALRESEEKYRSLVQRAPVGIISFDKEGRILEVNQKLLEILGSPSAEATKAINVLTFPTLVDAGASEVFRQCMEGGRFVEAEIGYTSKWGKGSYFRLLVTPMVDPDGNVVGCQAVVEDTSERTGAEKALRQSEDRMRRLIQSSPLGIGIVQDGKYAYANPALVRMMGCTGPDEIVGQSPLAFIVPEDRDMVRQRGKQRLEGLDPAANYQVGGLKKTGERFEVSIWPTRFDHEGKPSLLSFVADVTQENKLKAQLLQAQKMEAVGILAGGVAHDFNNLLTVVQGYSELLLMDKDEKAPGYSDLHKIHEAGLRGAELVQNLLAFSRKADTKPRPINLNHEVVRIEKLLNRTIPKMIKIDLHLDGGLAAINADSDRMGQILMNLAVNAEQAMPDGGELTIASTNVYLGEEYCSSYPGMKPGAYVLLTVSDTGHGMDKQTLEHIFEPFFTTKSVGKGTGLGLATVYGIIRQHGGHVTCCSEVGHGTTFKIYLPAIMEADTEGGTEPEQVLPRGGAETILLVDDEDFVRDLGQTLLNRAGYTVITAASGPEAVQLYLREGERISLIILDLIMPEMGGDKCLEEILALNPHAKILISSGAAVQGKTKETVESGAKGFVSKPFLLTEMLNTVREVLDSE